jgi:hypothetical protein
VHGLNCIDASEKEDMRALAIRGGPYSVQERDDLLLYCRQDVEVTAQLFLKMLPRLELWHAIHRGRYLRAVSRIIRTGIPMDLQYLERLSEGCDRIKLRLVQQVDRDFGVYDGTSFRERKWLNYLCRNRIPWPLYPDGSPDLRDETFSAMAKIYPQIRPIHELRYFLGKMRLSALQVGSDGRNRCGLGVFGTITSRNAPSNSKLVIGPATFMRSLIKPERGRAVANLDYSAEEFGIAAYRSNDTAMRNDYLSDDPYIALAHRAGAVPAGATKESHREIRDQFKTVALGVLYGIGDFTLGTKLNISPAHAHALLDMHRKAYKRYWEWSRNLQNFARLHGHIHSPFRWRLKVDHKTKPGTVANFPMQSAGAEILRWAAILTTEAGINVACPIHDAILIEGGADEIDDVVEQTRALMQQASELVLPGFPLKVDHKIFKWPERYSDKRGAEMWAKICALLDEDIRQEGVMDDRGLVSRMTGVPCHG